LISNRLQVRGAGAGLREQHRGIAGDPDQEEDRQREEEERDRREPQPLEDELLHSVLVCLLATGCWTLLRAGEVRAPKSDGVMPDSLWVSASERVNPGTDRQAFGRSWGRSPWPCRGDFPEGRQAPAAGPGPERCGTFPARRQLITTGAATAPPSEADGAGRRVRQRLDQVLQLR